MNTKMRLIDANEITKNEHQHYDYMADEYYVFVRDIENSPTIEAEPVRHAHWESKFENGKINTYCSACNCITTGLYHYCPNCGAKMDEVEHGNTDNGLEINVMKDEVSIWKI